MKESTSTIRRDAFGPRFVAGRSSRPRRSSRDNAFADAPRDMPVAASTASTVGATPASTASAAASIVLVQRSPATWRSSVAPGSRTMTSPESSRRLARPVSSTQPMWRSESQDLAPSDSFFAYTTSRSGATLMSVCTSAGQPAPAHPATKRCATLPTCTLTSKEGAPVNERGVISTFGPSGSTARVASCTRARSLSFGSILHDYDLLQSGSEVWTPDEVMTPKPTNPEDRRSINSCGHATLAGLDSCAAPGHEGTLVGEGTRRWTVLHSPTPRLPKKVAGTVPTPMAFPDG